MKTMAYTLVTKKKFEDLLFDWEIDRCCSERGQFLYRDSDSRKRVAADNRTKDFRVEEFELLADAEKWLFEC